MGRRLRCIECGRPTVPIGEPSNIPGIAELAPVMGTLVKLAREFDGETPDGECPTAVDFLDSVALSVKDALNGLEKMAGNPGNRQPSKAA